MARQAADLTMIGGKSPRQRIWEAIRASRKSFCQADIARRAKVSDGIVTDYFKCLEKGGVIVITSQDKIKNSFVTNTYRLELDNGLEAPRLTKLGKPVTQGAGNEAMWGTLRRMFKTESVDYRQLAAFASTKSNTISTNTAKTYLLALAEAGYLECVKGAVQGKNAAAARYRLLSAMDSGVRSPMIQRTKSVFDPNWNRTVWAEPGGVENE